MLQSVIDRMARTSASMKQYALTIAGAAIALAGTANVPEMALAAAALMLFFLALDARYLQQERWFRDLYDEVRGGPASRHPDFRISPDSTVRAKQTWTAAAFSWSILALYLPLIAFLLLAAAGLSGAGSVS